jgi:hypothetical protein
MQCCEILRINGIVTHEIGCPNQGKKVKRDVSRHYIAKVKGKNIWRMVTTALPVVSHYFPEYALFIGPFRTKRGARWAQKNPFGWGNVSDAENLAIARGPK